MQDVMMKQNDDVVENTVENSGENITESGVEVMEPAVFDEKCGLNGINHVDFDGLARFAETYSRTIKDMYYVGYEAGKNASAASSSSPKKGVKDTGLFIAVADNKAYAVYNSEEKFQSQRHFWNVNKVAWREFGKGEYETAVMWAAAQASRLSGVPANQIPTLFSVNYYTKVR